MKAVAITATGSAKILEVMDLPTPTVKDDHALVQVLASGVNFMDIGVREGRIWQDMPMPRVLGAEGVGRIIGLGGNAHGFRLGQRVAWAYVAGSYAEQVAVPVNSMVAVPDEIDDHTAASVMMQGLTASHFATDFYPVQPGDVALVHAAAGGVGQLLSQIIKLRGGAVIGRVSSQTKVGAALEAGADHVIVDTKGYFSDEVLKITNGEGVHVVYDGSGLATFVGSMASLRHSGTFCWFGSLFGKPERVDITHLPRSIKIGFGSFYDHIRTPELLRARAARLFDWIRDGQLRIGPARTYPLMEAAKAHEAMENRSSIGKLLLIP